MAADLFHCLHPRIAPALIGLLTCLVTGACAPHDKSAVTTDERRYDCDSGASFSAQFSNGKVRIDTGERRYDLARRPASQGVRYGSDHVAFAQDEDRAVLIGAAGGPYKGCSEVGFRLSDQGPASPA